MLRRSTLAPVVFAAAVLAQSLAPGLAAAQSAPIAIENPIVMGRDMNVYGERSLRDLKKVIVPTIVVRYALRGSLFVVNQGRGATARAKGRFVVAGLEKEYLQELSKRLYDDVVARLREAGYEVLTYDDLKDIPEVQRMPRYTADADWGMPTVNPPGGDIEYAMAFPSDAQAIDPPMQGYGWGFRKVMKDLNAGIVVPEYTIDAPIMGGETDRSISSRSASVNIRPRMRMIAMTTYTTEKLGGGGFQMKRHMENLGGDVGQVASVEDASPRVANALSRSLSILSGSADMQTSSTNYGMKVDREAYTAQFLRATVSWNTEVINFMKTQQR
ncbi:MAG: hypothetical protein IPJ78_15130 [Gemmatimonadetes bacterium]|nr:hypothetical protein [Gemmatimonadota bacterium]